MATVAQVLKASFQTILVQASEAALESDEFSDAIFTLNNYMQSLDADGIKLGWTDVSALADTLTVPSGALRGIIYNVAIELAPEYGGEVSAALVESAGDGMKTMEKLGVVVLESAFPYTLPRGTGNDCGFNSTLDRYYPDLEDAILAEAEIETNFLLILKEPNTFRHAEL